MMKYTLSCLIYCLKNIPYTAGYTALTIKVKGKVVLNLDDSYTPPPPLPP